MAADTKFRVQFDWRVTVLALCLLPVLLSLGFWQLDRAEEKRQLQALFDQRQQSGPVPIASLADSGDLRYQPVSLRGEFLNDKTLLLDNRIHQGRFGYEVVVPFRLRDAERIVLVNRGWVPGDSSRRSLPAPVPVTGPQLLTGTVYVPQGKLMVLAETRDTGWPRVVQSVDVDSLRDAFEQPLFAYTVRLDAGSPGALETYWQVVNVQPAKHTGYAVQWFAMSATLVLIALLANTNLWSLFRHR